MLRYALANASMLRSVLWSKVTPPIAAALVLSVATPLLPAAFAHLYAPWGGAGRRTRAAAAVSWAAWAGVLAAAVAASRLPMTPSTEYLREPVVVRLVREVFAPGEEAAGEPASAGSPTRLVASDGAPRCSTSPSW